MTIEQLQSYLIENSPFKFKGDGMDLFSFDKDWYSINDGAKYQYILLKEGENFIFKDGGLIPLFQNVKIEISVKEGLTVILNMDSRSLKNNSYRNKDAENGYLILHPLK